MQSPTKHRVVLIGCGNIARTHVPSILASEHYQLVAAADLFPAPIEAMKQIIGSIRFYNNTNEMLARERPDLAVIATTSKDHLAPTLAALRGGAHVLCEKPIAMTLEEADQMIACARETGRLLLINNEYNVSPRTLAGLHVFREGQIGDLIGLRCSFKGNFCGGWDLVEGGCHLFSLCMMFAGIPRWVSAHITTKDRPATIADIFDSKVLKAIATGLIVGDRVTAMVGFDRGVILEAEFRGVKTNAFVEVIGTKGIIHIPMGVSHDTTMICRKPYANPNDPAAKWEAVPVEWGRLATVENLGQKAFGAAYDVLAEWLKMGDKHPLAIDGKNPMDGEFARWTLESIHGVLESHFQEGDRITLPLDQRDHPLVRRVEKGAPAKVGA